jgi:phage-related protein
MFANLLNKLMPVITLLSGFIGQLIKAFAPFITLLINGLMPVLNIVMKMVLELSKQVLPNLVKIMNDVVIPLVQLLADTFADVIPIVMAVIEAVMPFITLLINLLAPILHIIINLFDKLMKVLKPVANFIKTVVVKAFQILADMLGPLWDGILKPLIEGIEKLLGIKVDATTKVKVKGDAKDLQKSVKDALDASLLHVSSAPKIKATKTGTHNGHNIHTTINTHTNASAKLIANNVVNAIKFNIPIAGDFGGSSMGSQVATG